MREHYTSVRKNIMDINININNGSDADADAGDELELESPYSDSFEYISDSDRIACDIDYDSSDSSIRQRGRERSRERLKSVCANDSTLCGTRCVSDRENEEEEEEEEDEGDAQDVPQVINALRLAEVDHHAEVNEYQRELRIYVNRCVFIRNTSIGKRVGFAPSLPKTKSFYMCWTCDDWIPIGSSPICMPFCSSLHLSSKYVFERMFGLFCSWECSKKYIHTSMTMAQRTKYMRSLHVLRKLFCPDIAYTAIKNIESRTEMNLWGGPLTPADYYSKIDKVNLRPLSEDICFWAANASSIRSSGEGCVGGDAAADSKTSEPKSARTGNAV